MSPSYLSRLPHGFLRLVCVFFFKFTSQFDAKKKSMQRKRGSKRQFSTGCLRYCVVHGNLPHDVYHHTYERKNHKELGRFFIVSDSTKHTKDSHSSKKTDLSYRVRSKKRIAGNNDKHVCPFTTNSAHLLIVKSVLFIGVPNNAVIIISLSMYGR